MADRGPRTKDVAEEVKDLADEVRDHHRDLTDSIGGLRTDLVALRSSVTNDLWWIKGIGAALLAGSGWMIWILATITADARHQDTRADRIERHLDSIEGKVDTLIHRAEPKATRSPDRGKGE